MPKNKNDDSWKNWLIVILLILVIVETILLITPKDVRYSPSDQLDYMVNQMNGVIALKQACTTELNAMIDAGTYDQEEIDEKQLYCSGYDSPINFYKDEIDLILKDLDLSTVNSVSSNDDVPAEESLYASSDDDDVPPTEENNPSPEEIA